MFGSCALNIRKFNFAVGLGAAFVLLAIFPQIVLASQKATVVHESASVFKDADFDSEILGEIRGGEVYDISNDKKGPFYRIRLKDGRLAYVPDNEVRIGTAVKKNQPNAKQKVEKKEEAKYSGKPFSLRRYRGPKVEIVNFTEDTMGKAANESLAFVGLNVAGVNTMFEGETYTDANLLFYSGAPSYYAKATGNSASGYILLANFTLETPVPLTKWYMFYYGFGGAMRMSHFDVTLKETSRQVSYALDDITLGALLNTGMAFQTGSSSLRFDLKYYLEKKFYPALGVSWVFQF